MAGDKAATPAASEVGTILAQRYEVVRELGRGGMGVVYLCTDHVTSERVALKRLKSPEEKTEERPEESLWFRQEARAVAALDHPAIVRARDFGTLSDGSLFLVMDVLPGRSVHEWMYTTQMPWAIVWCMVDQVLAGLAHAHARGIIHGDLKPSNIMLDLAATTGRGPRAFMLDLGLAWLRDSRHDRRLDGSEAPELAQHTGAGTVGWVAPEQIRKLVPLVGPPTDLYALGCVLYRVLSGKEVFEGNAQDVLRAHKRNPVSPPKLPETVPPQVSAFVLRLLEKKPWNRFEFATDARRYWNQLRPSNAPTLEQIVAYAPLTRPNPTSGHAKAVAPGLLSLRPAPLVAREEERKELLSAVADLVHGKGKGKRMLCLIGEAGVGKSRLAEWLCEQVHEQALMVPLRARYGRTPTPLDGLTGAVNAYFGLDGIDRAGVEQTLLGRWEVLKDDHDALTWVAATAEWLRPTPPGTVLPVGPSGKRFILDRPELRWAVMRRVLERIGRDRPILLWLDDLHLASPSTFEQVSYLFRDAPYLRLLAVVTARSESLLSDLDAALRLEAARAEWGGRVLELRPLASEETESLLRSALPLHDDAVVRAIEQSRGNPLFALQLLHAWAGGGYLQLDEGRYRVPEGALRGRPITTAELWDERVSAIPSELRLSAYAASALGEDIRTDVLKALVSALGMDARDAVAALTRAQILLAAGTDQLRWPHALLQEHLLDRLDERADAAAIYRLAARSLELHPAVGSRRIMKHRVTNLLRAGDDDPAARLMFEFIAGSWQRGRDTTATLRDLGVLDGRVTGWSAAEYSRWRAEALRHIGQLDKAQSDAESARRYFSEEGDLRRLAQVERLLGHIASDLGHPANGRHLVESAIALFDQVGDEPGRAQAEVVLGEIDYLLGEHGRARETLREATVRASRVGDALGRAQCLILMALIDNASGITDSARSLLREARNEFDNLGYRLGIAQSDIVMGHSDYRAFDMARARARALAARASFRELQNPRGEAACERLLAMVAIDTDDPEAARAHARMAERHYGKLNDPWGELEARLLLAQVSLLRGEEDAKALVLACDAIEVDEAEPRQHRHLTRAWLFQTEGRWEDAGREMVSARAVFRDTMRTGDHTPHMLRRFQNMTWGNGVIEEVTSWLSVLERAS